MAESENAPTEATPATAEEWKSKGNELYKAADWEAAIKCYSSAIEYSTQDSDIVLACKNNRAACYAQLKMHVKVVQDATEVIAKQPANAKALLRRMVAFDALGKRANAMEDAGAVLTMEPKNPVALEVMSKARKSLTKKLPRQDGSQRPVEPLAVFVFSEDRPLQCYTCLRSLSRHLKNVILDVHVFWQASNPETVHSYQLIQNLPESSRVQFGEVYFMEIGKKQLYSTFSRVINRMSVEGQNFVLLLSDLVLFHSDVDGAIACRALKARLKTHSVRLDINPRVEYFPEGEIFQPPPALGHFAEDPQLLCWQRWYDKSKQAFETVPREMGWNAILDWTATIMRVETVQHFFSALMPQPETVKEMDDKAADWLSRRQRMKSSELRHNSVCYEAPKMVTVDPAAIADEANSDRIFRAHLLGRWGENFQALSNQLKWSLEEVKGYFKDVDVSLLKSVSIDGLLAPERYAGHYFDSVRVPPVPPAIGLPKQLNPPTPLVSWLVPARNAEGFLWDCLLSITAQRDIPPESYEIILVNDASEDGTLALMRKFEENHPNVCIVDNEMQMGVAGAICAGWTRCRGDFVARLDADDIAEPDRLLKQLKYLHQHPTISVLGGRFRSFFTEERRLTIEKVAEKEDGRISAVAWREFHGNQTSRRREQITLKMKDGEVVVEEGPAEYHGTRAVRVGEELIPLNPERWKQAFKSAKGQVADVILQRRDPLEQPRGATSLHPMLVRANFIFELEPVVGTTATFRRTDFSDEGPYQREEAEGHWCWLSLAPKQHAANIADSLVRTRRHADNRAVSNGADILESKYAALQYHLTKTHVCDADMRDAAALLNFRGPATAEQGDKLMAILMKVQNNLLQEYIRPREADARGDFWRDFVEGREVALERAIVDTRARYKVLVDDVKEIITTVPEHSPRAQKERQLPR
mmetsp:Transcript_37774/g.70816  ORF Transcript_37774/g.70816 Transcript_37774/m.70816 type:complete len:927 (-) Transcript_37774:194-2974(-)